MSHHTRTIRMIRKYLTRSDSPQRYVPYKRNGRPGVFRNLNHKPLLHNGRKP